MKGSGATKKEVRFALWMIFAHYAVNATHGAAHSQLAIPLSRSQELFIVLVIVIAPVLAGALIWRGIAFGGGLLLGASLAGALVFGIWNHFVAISPDHVSHMPAAGSSLWKGVFQGTAILLVPTDALGCWAGLRLLKRSSALTGAVH